MIVEINKDLEKYKESVAMGLTAKQLIFSIASLVVGGGLILLLYPYVGLTIAVYISIPVVAPIALGGFYTYQGMSFYEVMKRRFYFMFHNKPLTYVSTESVAEIDKWNAEQKLKEKNKRKRGCYFWIILT